MHHAVFPFYSLLMSAIPMMNRPSVSKVLPVLRSKPSQPDYEHDPDYIRDLSALMALDYVDKVHSATAGR